jgi:hypothetical protein
MMGAIQEMHMDNPEVMKTIFSYYGLDYSGNYFGRLYKIKTIRQPGDSPVLQDFHHTWDSAGNMLQRNDVVAEAKENFEYDFLDRLISPSKAVTVNSLGVAKMMALSITWILPMS